MPRKTCSTKRFTLAKPKRLMAGLFTISTVFKASLWEAFLLPKLQMGR